MQYPRFLELSNLLLVFTYLIIVIIVVFIISKNFIKDKKNKDIFFKAFLFKIIMGLGFALVYEYIYDWNGDSYYYYKNSSALSDVFFVDTSSYFKMFFNTIDQSNYFSLPSYLPYYPRLYDRGIYAIHRFLSVFAIIGFKNYYLMSIILNSFLFIINWKFFRFLCLIFPDKFKIFAITILLFPSVTFWGSGLTKDGFTLSFCFVFIMCFYKLFLQLKFKVKHILLLLLSFYVLRELKPYILYSVLISCMVWIALHYSKKIKNIVIKYLFFPIIIVVFGISGFFILQKTASNVGGAYSSVNAMLTKASAAQYDLKQEYYQGSSFDIGDLEPNMKSAIDILPAAIIAGIFRPFLWEARSVTVLISGLENFILLLIALYIIYLSFKKSFIHLFRIIFRNPFLIFCIFFSIIMAVGIGISTSNFGALVRFKIPFFPFFAIFLLFLCSELKEQKVNKRTKSKV
ncbi:MAG: hypothetical protein LBV69_04435 [Bacteroidales bacterium]|jgi:hypothetical protein|nr:hypothetical protein [Bacteroidales bacterium]